MSLKNNIFSSKPKQIAQAAIQILLKVYGDLNSVNFLVLSDMKSPIDIAQNFEHIGLNKYEVFQESLDKIFNKKKEDANEDENFINKLKIFDLIMIGYKKHSKIIDKTLVKKILNKRKQKPILFIDCGIPGNIKTDIGQIPNCFLFDLNDLEQLYSSWIQNSFANEGSNNELFDIELKISLDSFFRKLKFNLEQKMIFEKKLNLLVKAQGKEIKFILKKFLKAF